MTYVGVQAFAANQRVTIIVCTRADCTDVQAAYEGNWRLVKQVLTSWSEHNLDDPAKEMLKQARELVEKGYVEHRRRTIILLKIAEHYESDSSKEIAALLSKLERE